MRDLRSGETEMLIAYVVFVITVLFYLGFQYANLKRRRADCAQVGHCWEPAGMGDDPRVAYICTLCFEELHY